ncbi:MAG: pentapeptide repeat-containing protein [Solirubrobacterales bacterium]
MSAYLVRAASAKLQASAGARDTVFVNQRFEDELLQGAVFEQCTFANVSFKKSVLRNCEFRACVFERCYFRRTEIAECDFPASRFISCEFIKPAIRASDFRHTRFERCFPDFAEMKPHLPGEDNLRSDLSTNLAVEADALGAAREARQYRLASIEANEQHLLAVLRGSTKWHQDHFDTIARLVAGGELVISKLNGALWGHGERAWRLITNIAIATLVVWPVIYLASGDVEQSSGSQVGLGDALTLSASSFLSSPEFAGLEVGAIAQWFVLGEIALGFVSLGLFVSFLIRWISRR